VGWEFDGGDGECGCEGYEYDCAREWECDSEGYEFDFSYGYEHSHYCYVYRSRRFDGSGDIWVCGAICLCVGFGLMAIRYE